jgi:protein-tyrosine phosphatase
MFDNHLRFAWHVKDLLAGSAQPGRFHTFNYDLGEIKKKGIKAIVSLDGDLKAIPQEFSEGLSFFSEPVPDGFPPTTEQMKRIVKIVKAEARKKKAVLVCCRGGIGRTATILAVLMMELCDKGMEEALEELGRVGRIPESMEQRAFISRWTKARARKSKPTATDRWNVRLCLIRLSSLPCKRDAAARRAPQNAGHEIR